MPEATFISIGSNIEPARYLTAAIARIGDVGRPIRVSRVYQNAALSPTPQPDYLNAAVLLETEGAPEEIRTKLKSIEVALGRRRSADRYAPRIIDLDLCLLGSIILKTPAWTLPDPELLERAYLAVPMAEVAPDFIHPLTGEPLRLIAARLEPAGQLTLRPDLVLRLPDN
ncbi:MAG: 2-amino-4-hydroxy-6-hydroxymethyldihydropteridine diphosphokinase [Candidatus Eisenbacteria bacterium]|nr:2-amino-4-hydroxy-6-hydroxymethyldihydropteridine diphosphokinase [Candidatus Eisenbacteria bacterium]MBU1947949.1 2-amino-4-hydroxy-6-hydroxymethyldihydropteridine diphosphokinase [Candidatus Eisenbacteria bacterium]